MIRIERYIDTTWNEPNIISIKKAKYLLGRFLLEKKALNEFIRCYKYYTQCNGFDHTVVDKLSTNEILYKCLINLINNKLPLHHFFNYDYVSINWWIPKSNINWYLIHLEWNIIIDHDIYVRKTP